MDLTPLLKYVVGLKEKTLWDSTIIICVKCSRPQSINWCSFHYLPLGKLWVYVKTCRAYTAVTWSCRWSWRKAWRTGLNFAKSSCSCSVTSFSGITVGSHPEAKVVSCKRKTVITQNNTVECLKLVIYMHFSETDRTNKKIKINKKWKPLGAETYLCDIFHQYGH